MSGQVLHFSNHYAMNPESLDVAQLRNHLARHIEFLRTNPNSQTVRQAAVNIATSITESGPLVREARELPPIQSLVPPLGVSSPTARDERFNAAIERLIVNCYAALDDLETFQHRMKENSPLRPAEYRALVLEYLVEHDNGMDPQWAGQLAWDLGFSTKQIVDALEDLERRGAIRPGERRDFLGGEMAWPVWITSIARDLAATNSDAATSSGTSGATAMRSEAPIVHQHFYHSIIGHVGTNTGTVFQSVAINPDLVPLLDALAKLRSTLGDDAVAAAPAAIIDATASEVRSSGLSEKARSLVSALPAALSGGVALLANAKPAYDILSTALAGFGITLPPLPGP